MTSYDIMFTEKYIQMHIPFKANAVYISYVILRCVHSEAHLAMHQTNASDILVQPSSQPHVHKSSQADKSPKLNQGERLLPPLQICLQTTVTVGLLQTSCKIWYMMMHEYNSCLTKSSY